MLSTFHLEDVPWMRWQAMESAIGEIRVNGRMILPGHRKRLSRSIKITSVQQDERKSPFRSVPA